MKVVQQVLGHASYQITADLYTHVVPVLMQDAADRMGEVLTSPTAVSQVVSQTTPRPMKTKLQVSDLHLLSALGGIRTPNLLIRSQMLYPLSYERRIWD
jgi:hypothetical protein